MKDSETIPSEHPPEAGEGGSDDPRPRIVVGIDGTPSSLPALIWAAEEAGLRRASLVVVHAQFARAELLDSYPTMSAEESRTVSYALDVARRTAPGISVRGLVAPPPAGEALVKASEEADLLVVGTHGRSGMERLAMGSVSAHCIRHAACTVVVVKPGAMVEAPTPDGASVPSARR